MFNAQDYMTRLTEGLRRIFGERLVYVGLQGSYLRNEATETSDIDPMVVIDGLSPEDLSAYKGLIETLEQPELSCGFLCGREDLLHWNRLEMRHLLESTKDIFGSLAALLPSFSREDAVQFVHLGLGNIYHELCHRYVHNSAENNRAALPYTFKGVFFLLQDLCWLRTGEFPRTKADLLSRLTGDDRAVMETAMALKDGGEYDFDAAFQLLFGWCQHTMNELSEGENAQ